MYNKEGGTGWETFSGQRARTTVFQLWGGHHKNKGREEDQRQFGASRTVEKEKQGVVEDLQSWTKVLGQIYIFGAFSHAPNKLIYTCSAVPLPPPLLQCWTRVHAISPEFQHCIGGRKRGGGRESNAF